MSRRDIARLRALEVLDAGGAPALEVCCVLDSGAAGRAVATAPDAVGPLGLAPLLDGGARHGGRGLRGAVAAVEGEIAAALAGHDASDQRGVDLALVDLDGTPTRARLGAGTLLAVSLAVARAAAKSSGLPLYRYLGGAAATSLPLPFVSLLSGGPGRVVASGGLEVMAVPLGAASFEEALRWALDVARAFAQMLGSRGLAGLGAPAAVPGGSGEKEGADAPGTAGRMLELALGAIESAGLVPGEQVALALDSSVAGVPPSPGAGEGRQPASASEAGTEIERVAALCGRFPVVSLEGPLPSAEPGTWGQLREVLGEGVQLVDGELLAEPARPPGPFTRPGPSALGLELARAGTLTEALGAVERARQAGLGLVAEVGSRETEDAALADLAVAAGCAQLRGGPASGSEHLAKYNRLLRIERDLGESALFPGAAALSRGRG